MSAAPEVEQVLLEQHLGAWCPSCEQVKPAALFDGPYCEDCSDDWRPSPGEERW